MPKLLAPAETPEANLPTDPIDLLRAWLADRQNPQLKDAAVRKLDRLGTVTVYVDGRTRTEGYFLSTGTIVHAMPGMPPGSGQVVSHPTPPRGEISVVPVPPPFRPSLQSA